MLGDATASWAVGYKNILWQKIVPGNRGVQVDICGDDLAKSAISELISLHGFVPIDKGNLSAAASLEPGRTR